MLITQILNAQSIPTVFKDWTSNNGTHYFFYKNEVKTDNLRNSYVVGATFNGNNYDVFLEKYNAQGELQYSVGYDGGYGDDIGIGVYIDASYNAYITGTTKSLNNVDIFTMKIDDTGNQQWINTYNGSANTDDAGVDIVGDANGKIFITGYTNDTNQMANLVAICYSDSGTQQWATSYNYTTNMNDVGVKIVERSGTTTVTGCAQLSALTYKYCTVSFDKVTGNITASGVGFNNNNTGIDVVKDMVQDIYGNIYIAGGVFNGSQGFNFDIVKLDAGLNIVWERTYDSNYGDDVANGIAVDASGNVFVTGYTATASQGRDFTTIKYTSNGTMQWVRNFNSTNDGDDEANTIALDADGNIYVAGAISTEIDQLDFNTLKYNTAGNLIWNIHTDGEAHRNDKAMNIAIDTDGGIIVTGESETDSAVYEYLTIRYIEKQIITPTDFDNETPDNVFSYYENRGQLINTNDSLIPEIRYYVQPSSPAFYIRESGHSFVFARTDTSATTPDTLHRIDVAHNKCQSHARTFALEEKKDYLNYFLPQCPQGVTEVRAHKRLITTELYPNIDLMYSSNQNGIKYYYIIKPGGRPTDICLEFTGATSINIDAGTNALTINSTIGSLTYERPSVYQLSSTNQIVPITGWYAKWIHAGGNLYNFNIGSYDDTKPLVIQVDEGHAVYGPPPGPNKSLEWSTYFGGDGEDVIIDVENNSNNFLWVGGYGESHHFPAWEGPYIWNNLFNQGTINCFVANFDNLRRPIWLTYFGGSGSEYITEIDLDISNKVYIVGNTNSTNFTNSSPNGINNSSLLGSQDGFFVVLNDDGSVYCDSYIGGDGIDFINGVSVEGVNSSLEVAIVGQTNNANGFPLLDIVGSTTDYYQNSVKGSNDAFIMRLNNSCINAWCTLFGGNGIEEFTDVEFNSTTSIVISGITSSSNPSSDYPNNPICAPQNDGTFPNCLCNLSLSSYNQTVYGGGDNDAILVEFNISNNSLIWSTYFGGAYNENQGWAYNNSNRRTPRICIAERKIYITGTTWTTNSGFPLHPGNLNNYFQSSTHSPNTNNFYISNFNLFREQDWCTFYGGSGGQYYVNDICSGGPNSIFLTGHANPSSVASIINYCLVPNQNEFPLCDYSTLNHMEDDAGGPFYRTFIAAFNKDPNNLLWSTRYGLSNTLNTNNGICASSNRLFIGGFAAFANQNSNYKLVDFDDMNDDDYFQELSYSHSEGVISMFNISSILSSVKDNEEIPNNSILIKPNPATDVIEIELFDKNAEIKEVKIIDNIGRLIRVFHLANSIRFFRTDVTELNAGLYFIQIRDNKGVILTNKFIKQ